MKLKVDQIRTYDEAGFRQRAACLCFKSECESEVRCIIFNILNFSFAAWIYFQLTKQPEKLNNLYLCLYVS